MISNAQRAKARKARNQAATSPAPDLQVVTADRAYLTTRPTPERLARGEWSKTADKDAGMLDLASDMIGRLGVEGKLTGQQVEAAHVFQQARALFVAELAVPGYKSCLAGGSGGHDSGDGNAEHIRAYRSIENRVGRIVMATLCHECDRLDGEKPRNLAVLKNALNVMGGC